MRTWHSRRASRVRLGIAWVVGVAAWLVATGRDASAQILVQVNPVKLSLTATPERPLKRDVQFTNLGDAAVVVHLRLSDWTLSEDGELSMAPAGSTNESLAGALSFVPSEFTVAPNQSYWAHLTLRLPAWGSATRWGVLLSQVKSADPRAASGPGSSAELGTTIFLSRIPSDEIHTSLGPINVTRIGGDSILVTTKVHNNGERQANVSADFALTDSTGARVQAVSISGGVVLPGRARRLEWICVTAMKPGAYRITASLDTGSEQPLLSEARIQWPLAGPSSSVAAQPAK